MTTVIRDERSSPAQRAHTCFVFQDHDARLVDVEHVVNDVFAADVGGVQDAVQRGQPQHSLQTEPTAKGREQDNDSRLRTGSFGCVRACVHTVRTE